MGKTVKNDDGTVTYTYNDGVSITLVPYPPFTMNDEEREEWFKKQKEDGSN